MMPRKPLLTALVLSVSAHLVLMLGDWIEPPQDADNPTRIRVNLQSGPEPRHQAIQAVAKPAAGRRVPPPVPTLAAPAINVPVENTTPSIAAAAPRVADAEQETPAPPARAEVSDPVVQAHAAPSTFKPDPVTIKSLPRNGSIHYALNYFLNGTPTLVGRTVQTWQAVDNQYKLESHAETVGLARLLAARFGPRVFSSSGAIDERGLQPHRFTSRVVMRGKADESMARFDWSSQSLSFGRADDPKSARLPVGSQDVLSFLYQLSLAPPPPGRITLPITNGVRFESYEIDVHEEETIDTPLGRLRTLPVKQLRRQGRESLDVWLAADYHYLPVRIIFVNRDGTPGGEQLATEIRISEK